MDSGTPFKRKAQSKTLSDPGPLSAKLEWKFPSCRGLITADPASRAVPRETEPLSSPAMVLQPGWPSLWNCGSIVVSLVFLFWKVPHVNFVKSAVSPEPLHFVDFGNLEGQTESVTGVLVRVCSGNDLTSEVQSL